MAPLLLLLLLHESLAHQVCLSISDYSIDLNGTYPVITENRVAPVLCVSPLCSCVFLCTFRDMAWFNGTSACLEADVQNETLLENRKIYKLKEYHVCYEHLCVNTSILPLIESLNPTQYNLMALFHIRDSCINLFNEDNKLKWTFIHTERNIIHTIIKDNEHQSFSSYNLKHLSMNVINVSEAPPNSTIQVDAPQLLPQNLSLIPRIWLPVDGLKNIPEEQRTIGLVSYLHHDHFQFQQEKVASVVIRIELQGGVHLSDLDPPIKMIFRVQTDTNQKHNDSQFLCHYFDEFDEHDSPWKTDGCETHSMNQSDELDFVCYCDHSTPFAVLLIRDPIAAIHWEILSYISYIGCGLSAFFTALSFIIYVFGRNHKLDYSLSIHVSLSGALFLLNSTFLLTEWGAALKLEWVCVFVAAFMHYSLLCSFTWMAIEALHLYLLLIKVFNTYYKHYLLKLSLAGWGIPGVIVAVSVGMKDFKQFYGITQVNMADTNQTSSICWITDDTFFYSVNLVYFTLIFIFNAGIMVLVASSICKMKQVLKPNLKVGGDRERFSASCRSGLTLLGLTCLMGTTWGLAFLGSGYVNYFILYLFCILNSTQGFFIFLWICLSVKKQRKRAMEDRTSSAPVRTSGIKSE